MMLASRVWKFGTDFDRLCSVTAYTPGFLLLVGGLYIIETIYYCAIVREIGMHQFLEQDNLDF